MNTNQSIPSDFPTHDAALATKRFFADAEREAAAINAIEVHVSAAGYGCSRVRGWKTAADGGLDCVCDLFIDDIRLGEMEVAVAFKKGTDAVAAVTTSFGTLLDIRGVAHA